MLDEAKHKGIDLAQDHRFADVACLEVTPRYAKKVKLTVAIELTDFSVY